MVTGQALVDLLNYAKVEGLGFWERKTESEQTKKHPVQAAIGPNQTRFYFIKPGLVIPFTPHPSRTLTRHESNTWIEWNTRHLLMGHTFDSAHVNPVRTR